jgi:hypothetical protein
MSDLDTWQRAAIDALDLGEVDIRPVLGLARDVAHQVMRPAAPIAAYLLGIAVGRGANPAAAARILADLAASWEPPAAQ